MNIPRSQLPHRVTVEPYEGTSGTSAPVYGPPVRNVPALVEARRQTVRTGSDTQAVCAARALLRPDVTVPELSRITVTKGTARHEGQTFTALAVTEGIRLGRAAAQELALDGPK